MLVLWPILSALGATLAWLETRLTGGPIDPIAHDLLRELATREHDAWFWSAAVLVVTVVPMLEELMYRGLLQGALRHVGLPVWPAIGVASVLFAAMHLGNTSPAAVVLLFVLSLGFGWAYERTGRLIAPIAMHGLFNLVNLLVAGNA
jgi:membrane protease YdiL (CAAX protease family)